MDNLERCEADIKFYSDAEIANNDSQYIKPGGLISPVSVARLNDLDQVLSGEIAETKIRHHAFSHRYNNRKAESIFNKQQMQAIRDRSESRLDFQEPSEEDEQSEICTSKQTIETIQNASNINNLLRDQINQN